MAKIDDFEMQLRLNCNIGYDLRSGEEMVNTSVNAVLIAFDEWLKTCAGNPAEQITEQQCNIADVSGSLQEHKEVIRELMNTYIINLNEDGEPKASITDIMKLIDRAVALVGNDC